uniref:Putative hexokinase n=1 Tax=Ixodes ricinus TaxID=34613 RepID=A0A0K8R4P8_IXORI
MTVQVLHIIIIFLMKPYILSAAALKPGSDICVLRPTTLGPLRKAHDEVMLRVAVNIKVRAIRRKPAAILSTYHTGDTVFVAKVMKDLFLDTSPRASPKHVCSKRTG